MKFISSALVLILIAFNVCAQAVVTDTSQAHPRVFESIEREPAFPGGIEKFFLFVQRSQKYPEVASLLGIKGKIRVSFTVGKDGVLKNIRALDTIGFGFEQEAVRIVRASPRWTPGLQNSIPVSVSYTITVVFNKQKEKIELAELGMSDYAFIFEINGTLHTIDEVVKISGRSIPQGSIAGVTPYADKQRYLYPGKKGVYLIKLNS